MKFEYKFEFYYKLYLKYLIGKKIYNFKIVNVRFESNMQKEVI